MRYYSTNKKGPAVTLKRAVLKGLAGDGGLFMPEKIPEMPAEFFERIGEMSFQEISFEVAKALLGDDLPSSVLRKIVEDALNFDVPLVQLDDSIYVLELFHGPTLAFKDIGARFMARLLSHFVKGDDRKITVLVATSGDTGSAVGNGFLDVNGVEVVILYPSGKVSDIQEKQLTTLGNNITALEIKGTFDDCQKLVKQVFVDKELSEKLVLTSANSINIARLIPQMFYYFYAYAQLKDKQKSLVISVPSGNFGNLTAGLFAKKMGLPVAKYIAATNVNDVVPEYLETGLFEPRESVRTLSNAMDVGNPSNFARILELYGHDLKKMKRDLVGYSFTDEETKKAIAEVFEKYGYTMDPHGAVGYLGLKKHVAEHLQAGDTSRCRLRMNGLQKANGVFLETAHPSKFKDVVEKVIRKEIEMPEGLKKYLLRRKESVMLGKEFGEFRDWLLDK